MLGGQDHTPYDIPATVALACLGLCLLAGLLTGHRWTARTATAVRRTAFVLAVGILAVVHIVTPTQNGIDGAGRLLTLWPAAGLDGLLYALWAWRARRA